eukprot:Phypoly_transcript_13800.p1 GENE.Phypoly_transcript_13800~~Phypoly_transcript_13800.p1  ORF type:complete len:278 (+),score=71.49 Phypoly_transcript_13800:151-984(+)
MAEEQKSPEEVANASSRAYIVAASFWKLDKKYIDLPEQQKVAANKRFMQDYITENQNAPAGYYMNEEQVLLLLNFIDLLLAQLAPCDWIMPVDAFLNYCKSNIAKENELFIKDGNVTAPVTEAIKDFSLEQKEIFQQIVEYFMRYEKDSVRKQEEPELHLPTTSDEAEEDESGLQKKDIEMVMLLKKVSHNEAVKILRETGGEILPLLEKNDAQSTEPQPSSAKPEEVKPEHKSYNISEKDIALVMDQSNASREKSIEALKKANGDIVHAIMDLCMM